MNQEIPDKTVCNYEGKVKDFKDFKISTETVIGISNLKINLVNFFNYMPITNYTPIEKKRGRKRRVQIPVEHTPLTEGSIVSLEVGPYLRGVCIKKKKKKRETIVDDDNKELKPASFFRHTVTCVLVFNNNKFINIKVYANGKFHMTGCKNDYHFTQSVIYIYELMKEAQRWTNEEIFTINEYIDDDNKIKVPLNEIRVIYSTVMENKDFAMGFKINRKKLHKFINLNTEFRSVWEGSLLAGVNIKIVNNKSICQYATILKYNILEKEKEILKENRNNYDFIFKKKLNDEEKYHTFLVFSSGKVIMSSIGPEMEETFYKVVNTLLVNKEQFKDDTVLEKRKKVSKNKKKTLSEEEKEDNSLENIMAV
jgi:TATA-box binding protein (TBP) (component of TFIID and TFIIIB)